MSTALTNLEILSQAQAAEALRGVSVSTLLTIVGAACTTLLATIGALWKIQTATQKRTETKLDHCEAEHKEQAARVAELREDIGELKGRMEGHAEARDTFRAEVGDVADLCKALLKRLDSGD